MALAPDMVRTVLSGASEHTSMLSIGSLQLESRVLLAPIAGHTDLAFRLLCRRLDRRRRRGRASCRTLTQHAPAQVGEAAVAVSAGSASSARDATRSMT